MPQSFLNLWQSPWLSPVTPQAGGRASLRRTAWHRSPSCNDMGFPESSVSPTALTGKHTRLIQAGFTKYSQVCFWLTSLTGSPQSRARRTLQQCLGGDVAASLCSKSAKNKQHLKCYYKKPVATLSPMKNVHFDSCSLEQKGLRWLLCDQGTGCKARGVQPGPALVGIVARGSCPGQPHREDIPWGHTCRQEGHRPLSWSTTARTEPTALKSVSI